jgi:hypothetical protein
MKRHAQPRLRLTRRGRNLRDITLASLLTIPLALVMSLDMAEAAPVREPVQKAATVQAKKQPMWRCNNWAAMVLHRAGFSGYAHKQAWAITWRESKHKNLDESSPWYTGALGMWQIQTSAHSGKPWWSRSAMLNPAVQSRIVYKYMSNKGRYWRPWGLTPDGRLDTSHFRNWSSWQHENWIMRPYRQGLALYPCKTLPPRR